MAFVHILTPYRTANVVMTSPSRGRFPREISALSCLKRRPLPGGVKRPTACVELADPHDRWCGSREANPPGDPTGFHAHDEGVPTGCGTQAKGRLQLGGRRGARNGGASAVEYTWDLAAWRSPPQMHALPPQRRHAQKSRMTRQGLERSSSSGWRNCHT